MYSLVLQLGQRWSFSDQPQAKNWFKSEAHWIETRYECLPSERIQLKRTSKV